jgi:type IV pilus assembly protein PilO
MERSFGAMLRQLPSKAEIANLLIDISQTRLANSLEEELFQPQAEQPKEFYAVVPSRIIVHGTYHEMGGFVSGVAALPRIVTIEDVDIRPAKGEMLRMTAVAKTYRYLDEAELAAAAPKKPKGRRK